MQRIMAIVLALAGLLTQLLVLQHCATPTPPQGGARDTIGPILVEEETTPPYQTNFRPQQVELTFDEWVQLKDPTQIIISPPVEPLPKFSLKKRTLIVDFGEAVLRDSATYVINVGEAVVDLTEGNPAENLRFVFATGPTLDSASVSGRLVDAYTREPIESALFALYANLADTAVTTENPFYFAKSNKEGVFEISNVRPGTYRGIALDNGGLGGYRLNEQSTSQVGILDSFLTIEDGQTQLGDVRLFTPDPPLRIIQRDTSRVGLVKLTIDRPAERLTYQANEDYGRIDVKDTVKLFYLHEVEDTILLGIDTLFSDTLRLRPASGDTLRLVQTAKGPRQHNPTENYWIAFSVPPVSVDTPLVQLFQDTLPTPVFPKVLLDSLHPERLLFRHGWEEDRAYRLWILPGGLTDFYGRQNQDTVKAQFQVLARKKLGNLTLNIAGLDSTQTYIGRLVKGGNRDLVKEFVVPIGNVDFTQAYQALEPTTYQLELITDQNGNGRYDPGEYAENRLPEPVTIFPVEALRANWDVEAAITVQ